MSRTILITGGQGQVGQELARYAWPDGVDVVLPERDALDLADRDNGLPNPRGTADSRLDIGRIGRDYGIFPRSWQAMITSTVAELAQQQEQGS